MHLRQMLIVGALGSLLTACGSPSGPSENDGNDNDGNYVDGTVTDTAFRPLTGARVEILDGRYAGASRSADQHGNFQFIGATSGAVTLRANRDGFESATMVAEWRPRLTRGWTNFLLNPFESPLAIAAGRYTLTVTSDPSTGTGCADFPAELATRFYEGVIRLSSVPNYQDHFSMLPTIPTVTRPYGNFSFGVAGQFVGWGEIDDNMFFEEFPGFRYLMIYGSAPTTEPARSTDNSLTIPFSGDFRYCQLTIPLGGYNDCSQVPAAQIVDYRACSSSRDTMLFTKR